MIGFCVPHFWSVHCRVEMKYTSHLNGDSKPYFHPRMVDRIGMFLVSSVYMPGSLTSASWPSLTNPAACPSRTMSLAPFLISFLCRVNRWARISCWLGSVHSIMSMNCPLIQLPSPMTCLRVVERGCRYCAEVARPVATELRGPVKGIRKERAEL